MHGTSTIATYKKATYEKRYRLTKDNDILSPLNTCGLLGNFPFVYIKD